MPIDVYVPWYVDDATLAKATIPTPNDFASFALVKRRARAFLLDLGFTAIATWGVSAVASLVGSPRVAVVALFVVPALTVILNTLAVWRFGSSLTQRIFDLVVVDRLSRRNLGFGNALLRSAIIFSPVLLSCATEIAITVFADTNPSIAYPLFVALVWSVMGAIAAISRAGALHDVATRSSVVRRTPSH